MNFCVTSGLEDHIIRYPSVFIQLSINFPFNLYYVFILTCFRLSRDRRLKANGLAWRADCSNSFLRESFHFYLNGLNFGWWITVFGRQRDVFQTSSMSWVTLFHLTARTHDAMAVRKQLEPKHRSNAFTPTGRAQNKLFKLSIFFS